MTSFTLPPPTEWSARHIVSATVIVAAIALGFWLLYQLRLVVVILFTAIIISTALKPLLDRLHDWGVPPLLGGFLIYAALVVGLFASALLVFPLLIEQVAAIVSSLPGYYREFRLSLAESPNLFLQNISWRLPQEITLGNLSTGGLDVENSETITQTLDTISLTLKGIFITIATLMLSLYWSLDRERTVRNLLFLLPQAHRDRARELVSEMEIKLGSFIRGQAILCLAIGLMALFAYLVIGIPYAVALALFAGLMEAVPYVGPVLGAVPAVIMAASVDPEKAIWVIIATLIIQQIENTFLVPRVMSRAVGVNAFVALLAIFVFGSLGGVLGVLLAIPIAAILQLLLDHFVLNSSDIEQQQVEFGRDRLSRLRYYAHDLIQDVRKHIRDDKLVSDADGEMLIEEDIEAIVSDLESILAQGDETEATA